ncbi:tRNA pseudouridine(65) synthase TruC [Bowmanella denitrificans]|uniref:tRNA pseudouridine(65) synthase TruC n=1 Tax=Bowmanella denitrificans TaxID=366582 RepID=UPI000C99E7A1
MSDFVKRKLSHKLLTKLTNAMQHAGLWHKQTPAAGALLSQAPFCVDTLQFEQWLQFVFLPRMNSIITQDLPLPGTMALLPMAEQSWGDRVDLSAVLTVLSQIDDLYAPMPTLPVLYQDDYLVAVHKPAGLLVHRSVIDKYETRFAMQAVRDQIGQPVYTVHRLDKPTSGVLLFALSQEAARRLTEQFTQGAINKTYRAIVRGFTPDAGRIDYALKEKLDKIADKQAKTDKPAQSAVTDYKTLQRFELPFAVRPYQTARYSLLELYPQTGRKHQIRRHMAHIRHPIVGDVNHGDGKHNALLRREFSFNRLGLCAWSMSLIHPFTQQALTITLEQEPRFDALLTRWHHYQIKE